MIDFLVFASLVRDEALVTELYIVCFGGGICWDGVIGWVTIMAMDLRSCNYYGTYSWNDLCSSILFNSSYIVWYSL